MYCPHKATTKALNVAVWPPKQSPELNSRWNIQQYWPRQHLVNNTSSGTSPGQDAFFEGLLRQRRSFRHVHAAGKCMSGREARTATRVGYVKLSIFGIVRLGIRGGRTVRSLQVWCSRPHLPARISGSWADLLLVKTASRQQVLCLTRWKLSITNCGRADGSLQRLGPSFTDYLPRILISPIHLHTYIYCDMLLGHAHASELSMRPTL